MTVKRIKDVRKIPELVKYGESWHARSQYSHIKFDREWATETIRAALIFPTMALWTSEINGKLEGMCIGTLGRYTFSKSFYATDLLLMADKEGAKLFYALRNWAREHEAVQLQVSVTSGIGDADKIGKFYTKSGMTRLGGFYSQNLR